MIHTVTCVADPIYLGNIEDVIGLVRDVREVSYVNNVAAGFIWEAWDDELAMSNSEIREQLEECLIEGTGEIKLSFVEEVLVGFVLLRYEGSTLTIGLLCVKEKCRGLLVGSGLLEETLTTARKYSYSQLIVSTEYNNQPAMSLYKKFGLVPFTVEMGLRL